MATNVVYNEGDNLSWPVAEGTKSGDFVMIGDQGLFGVAMTDRGEGGNADTHASIQHQGVFALPVSTTTAADIGDIVYAVAATGVLTPAAGSAPANIPVGWFYSAKSTTANEVVSVRLGKV